MALQFNSTSGIMSRVASDHQSHTRSLVRTLASAIAARLQERTSPIDGRSKSKPRISGFRSESTASGSTKYSIEITQIVPDDLSDEKRRAMLTQQDSVKNQINSKNGVLGLLSSQGVR